MQQQIVVREGFGLPCGIKGIAGDGFAVHTDIQMLSLCSIAGTGIIPQPAFDSASFIVIGTGAFGIKITSYLKAIYIELAHIVSYFIKILNKLMKFLHSCPPRFPLSFSLFPGFGS